MIAWDVVHEDEQIQGTSFFPRFIISLSINTRDELILVAKIGKCKLWHDKVWLTINARPNTSLLQIINIIKENSYKGVKGQFPMGKRFLRASFYSYILIRRSVRDNKSHSSLKYISGSAVGVRNCAYRAFHSDSTWVRRSWIFGNFLNSSQKVIEIKPPARFTWKCWEKWRKNSEAREIFRVI